MYRFKRLLVGLELGSPDRYTIQYAAKISRMANSEKIYFIHVASSLDIPEEVKRRFPDIQVPYDEQTQEKMKKLVDKYFSDGCPSTEFVFDVIAGNPTTEILRRSRQKLIDLVIVGKRLDAPVGVSIPVKIARKAPCSVLIVPEGSPAKIHRILVPVDFSVYSRYALEKAVIFAEHASFKPPISCLHVFEVPWSYIKTGNTYDEFAMLMNETSRAEYQRFVENVDFRETVVEPMYILNDETEKAIMDTAKNIKADFLVVGNRGKSPTAALFLGSTTEILIQATRFPILIVREKGEGAGLLDILLK